MAKASVEVIRNRMPVNATTNDLVGAGLGIRRGLLSPLESSRERGPEFLEAAPENWIKIGGRSRRNFDALVERTPLTCHGLSLSLGSPDPLDWAFLGEVRDFLHRYKVRHYTEHLSYCSNGGHLYDLMPIPFTGEAVTYVATRIQRVQDFLGQRIGIENISYYAALGAEMSEVEFINAVLEEADCDLLLDVNNVYVNSINHGYDPFRFLDALRPERICYIHIAGHYDEAQDLKVDTHGSAVIDPVWSLLAYAFGRFGVLPTLLERDFNFPPLVELFNELEQIRLVQSSADVNHYKARRIGF